MCISLLSARFLLHLLLPPTDTSHAQRFLIWQLVCQNAAATKTETETIQPAAMPRRSLSAFASDFMHISWHTFARY